MTHSDLTTTKERHIHEECGVFGIFSKQTADLASLAYYGLFALQHRGQESAGIVLNDDGVFTAFRDTGLVNEVFTPEHLATLGRGNIVVGHVRYATTGSDHKRNLQPLVINHHKGRMALAHNGNLTNSMEPLRNCPPKALASERAAIFSLSSTTTNRHALTPFDVGDINAARSMHFISSSLIFSSVNFLWLRRSLTRSLNSVITNIIQLVFDAKVIISS